MLHNKGNTNRIMAKNLVVMSLVPVIMVYFNTMISHSIFLHIKLIIQNNYWKFTTVLPFLKEKI